MAALHDQLIVALLWPLILLAIVWFRTIRALARPDQISAVVNALTLAKPHKASNLPDVQVEALEPTISGHIRKQDNAKGFRDENNVRQVSN